MSEKDTGDILKNLSPEMKKEILQGLVASLAGGLTDADKKDVLKAVLPGCGAGRELIDMVGH